MRNMENWRNPEKEKMKISFEKRNDILDRARRIIETGKKEEVLEKEEEEILKEIAGVIYSAYKKAMELMKSKELGGIVDEREH